MDHIKGQDKIGLGFQPKAVRAASMQGDSIGNVFFKRLAIDMRQHLRLQVHSNDLPGIAQQVGPCQW